MFGEPKFNLGGPVPGFRWRPGWTSTVVLVILSVTALSIAVPAGAVATTLDPWMLLFWASSLLSAVLFCLLLAYMEVLPHRRTKVDDVFLLHNSGILISHYSSTLRPDLDSDIASGMLMAVRNFVGDALRSREGALKELRYGDYRIRMVHGKFSVLVIFAHGDGGRILEARMSSVLKSVERTYNDALEDWHGDLEEFKGVGNFLVALTEP